MASYCRNQLLGCTILNCICAMCRVPTRPIFPIIPIFSVCPIFCPIFSKKSYISYIFWVEIQIENVCCFDLWIGSILHLNCSSSYAAWCRSLAGQVLLENDNPDCSNMKSGIKLSGNLPGLEQVVKHNCSWIDCDKSNKIFPWISYSVCDCDFGCPTVY